MSDTDRERRLMDLLGEILELEGEARQRALEEVGAEDPAMRSELEELLGHEEDIEGRFLELPATADVEPDSLEEINGEIAPTADMPMPAVLRFGSYRVVETLGRGGMGTVYKAQQTKPVRRKVALKVIDAIHDVSMRKRFAIECQALARLAHPNVASLYEVGTTEGELPFVVMELIDGTTITTWCDEHNLELEQRIELFQGVCAGIRHAHEKGILHRDLKANNVLVTEVDGRPTAKVIDFGIARSLDDSLLSSTAHMTLDNQVIGSPAYLSPEAALGDRDVDTRSDVYSLGLLLYELLAGVQPFDTRQDSLMTLLRRVIKEERPPIHQRFAALESEERLEIAARRGLDERRLRRRLRGDLEAILGKALHLDRDERYSSPADLAADLQAHLEHRPVSARAATMPYVLQRFLRRRAGAALSMALLILALGTGVVARTREAHRANLEAQRAREALQEAQQVSNFFVDLFEIADPERNPDEPVDVRELLERGAADLRDGLADQPLARARFLFTIAEIYRKMALFEPAEPLVAEALAIRRNAHPNGHSEVLESINQLGVLYRRQGRLEEAEELLREVLEVRQKALGEEPLKVADAYNNLGNVLLGLRRFEEAEALQRRALEIREEHLPPGHEDIAETVNNLGAVLLDDGRPGEARPFFRRMIEMYTESHGSHHPRVAAGHYNLGFASEKLGELEEAVIGLETATTLWREAYGPKHPRTLRAMGRHAYVLRRLGLPEQSTELRREILSFLEANPSPDRAKVASELSRLGWSLGEAGDLASAEAAFERSLELRREHFGESSGSVVSSRANLGWLELERGNARRAEAILREVHEFCAENRGPEHSMTLWALHYLALSRANLGRRSEAEDMLRSALEGREAKLAANHRYLGQTLLELGELVRRDGRDDEAKQLLRRAEGILLHNYGPRHHYVRRVWGALEKLGESPHPTEDGPMKTGPSRAVS